MASKPLTPDTANEAKEWSWWKVLLFFVAMVAFFALFLFYARAPL